MKISTPFGAWCAAQGIVTPLQLQHQKLPSSRYMSCDTDLAAGSQIVDIPLSACLVEDSKESLVERLVFEKELGPKSSFAQYLDTLPTFQDGNLAVLPHFWSDKRRQMVTDSGQLEVALSVSPPPTSMDTTTPEAWAWSCVETRANFIDSEFQRVALMPVLDLLNHDAAIPTSADLLDGGEERFVMTVGAAVPAHQQVYISYGDLTNLECLVQYGFCPSANPCNVETVIAPIVRCPVPAIVRVDSSGSIPVDVFASVREQLATPQELLGHDTAASFLEPISKRNEEEVLAFLSGTLYNAVDEARDGQLQAEKAGDDLVATYLRTRADTLNKGLVLVDKELENLL